MSGCIKVMYIMPEERIRHLEYDETLYNPIDYHDAIIKLLSYSQKLLKKEKNNVELIDIGSGHGTLLKRLKEEGYKDILGVDFDEKCVEMSSRYAKCYKLDIDNIDTLNSEKRDVAILSHVLEHIENPRRALEKLQRLSNYIIIVVPNPSRIKVLLKYNLFSKNYSNQGHFYCWDHSHFANFLINYCNLEIVKWGVDRVYVFPFRRFRCFLRYVGLLDRIEIKFLPRFFPYFSNSLIVLCKRNS